MKRRQRIYYTEEQKALMWDRWKQGDSLGSIARLFDRQHSSIDRIIREHGKYFVRSREIGSRSRGAGSSY